MKRSRGGWSIFVAVLAQALTLPRTSTWAAGIETSELSGADMSPDVASDSGLGQEPDLNRFAMAAAGNAPEETSGGIMEPRFPVPTRILGTGKPTSGNEGFHNPSAAAIDKEGKVYVADTMNHRVQIFNAQGNYLRTLGTGLATAGNEGFKEPHGVAVDGRGNVYVGDTLNHRVQVFDAQGNYLRTIGTGQLAFGNEGFIYPYDVAIDGMDNIYVADPNNQRIQVFDAQGNYLRTLSAGQLASGNEGFCNPFGVTVDSKGNVHVVDFGNHRIQSFDAQGRYLGTLGFDDKTDAFYPTAVAVDGEGNFYVPGHDHPYDRIRVFDAQRKFLETIAGSRGTLGNERFGRPNHIIVDGEGAMYVTDYGTHRVVIFSSIARETVRLKRELDKTVKQADWDGDGDTTGGRFKIWDSSLRDGKP